MRCNCNAGATCQGRGDCGRGLFCSVADPWELPMCKRCDTCTSNRYEIAGSCAMACPTADMSGLASLPHLSSEEFLFLSFVASEISQQGAYVPSVLLSEEIASWVAAQGLGTQQANLTLARLLPEAGAEAVATTTWMTTVTSTSSLSLMCPSYDLDQPWYNQTRVVSQGCFCNSTELAQTFRCPAGQRCSPAAYRGLETDALSAPLGQMLRAVCVPCLPGQYCPEGTYVQDESSLGSLDCPSGSYCPSPAERRACPPGSFCTARSTSTITCNYEQLLLWDPYKKLPLEPETVVVRLRDKRDPLRGNYCPASSEKPYEVCSAGFYCPNVSTKLVCPKGHYCKAQSTAPWKCSVLARCPEGTTVPVLSYMAFLIAGIVIAGIPLIYFALTQLDKSVMVDADEEGDNDKDMHRTAAASRMTFRLLKSIKLSHNPLENKYRGFGQVSPAITLEFDSLGLQIRPRGGEVKNVLMGVSGSFAPRRLNAILGPSGCGKTTFLNVLCGKISAGVLMGKVRINGEELPLTRLRNIMGFVPQDDIVHEDLTVRENLNYSARLRLPADMTRQRRRDVVRDALEMLGLTAIQHYRVGTVEKRGISGGQRKRVNIGLELVAMPSLLFLDEPTSGLDATSSADILSSLVDMANLGMNIIMVIHQPRFSSFLIFDQVLLLGTGGRTVYLGSPSAAMLYFTKYLGFRFPERENPSDILMDIIAGKVPCTDDPKLKTCSQLVDKWTDGGMAWVETLEALNPTMCTKMSDVDPTILTAIDEEFEILDEEGRGALNAGQLVKLFQALNQNISLEDAIIMIKKVNANRPASAQSTTSTGEVVDADGLTLTKQQLLDAFQGVREGHNQAQAEGDPQRTAAAKFYASQFLLPDLPEVKAYREQAARERAKRGIIGGGSGAGSLAATDSGFRIIGAETMLLPTTRSAGGMTSSSGTPRDRNVDSDSYSPVLHRSTDSAGNAGPHAAAAAAAAAAAVAESIGRRTILSPGHTYSAGGRAFVGDLYGGGLTVRSRALPPGVTVNTSTTSSACGDPVANVQLYGCAGGNNNTDVDLSEYAAQRRAQYEAKVAAGLVGAEEEEEDGLAQGPLQAGGGYRDGVLRVGRGLAAGSLAAMEALARADVPLPELPRRAAPAALHGGPSRSERRSTTYAAIAAYVNTYNEIADADADAAGGGVEEERATRPTCGSRPARGAAARNVSALAAAAAGAAARRSGAAAAGEGDMWAPRTSGAPSMVAVPGAAPAQLRRSAAGSRGPKHSAAAQQRGSYEEHEVTGAGVKFAAPSVPVSQLPPLLQQLAAGGPGGGGGGRGRGPVAEATEDERAESDEGAAAADSNGAGRAGSVTAADAAQLPPPSPPRPLAMVPPAERQLAATEDTAAGAAPQLAHSAFAPLASIAEADTATATAAAAAGGDAAGNDNTRQQSGELTADSSVRGAVAIPLHTAYSDPPPAPPPLPPWLQRKMAAAHGGQPSSVPPLLPGGALVRGGAALREGSNGGDASGSQGASADPSQASFGGALAPGSSASYSGAVSGTLPPAPMLQLYAPGGALPPVRNTVSYSGTGSIPGVVSYSGTGAMSPRTRTTRLAVTTTAAVLSGGGSSGQLPEAPSPAVAAGVLPGRSGGSSSTGRAPGGGGGSTGGGSIPRSATASGGGGTPGSAGGSVHRGGSVGGARRSNGGSGGSSGGHGSPMRGSPEKRISTSGSPQMAGTPMRPRHSSTSGIAQGAAPARAGNQRRRSWLQASFSSQGTQDEPTTPGGTRKPKKDTLYVNSLLSNALVGAWATHQSVTAGRGNHSVARLLRLPQPAPAAGADPTEPSPEGSNTNTPRANRTGNVARSMASMTGLGLASKAPSSVNLATNGAIVAKLAMEEALASRHTQGFFMQLGFLLRRGAVKYVRSFWPMRVVDTMLQLAAAFIIGLVHGTDWGHTAVPSNAVMCMVCLGVLSCVTHLRTFSQNRVLLWREAASGMSTLAYYLSQNIIDQLWVFTAPALSLGVYYYLTLPRMPFSEFYVVGLFVCWWASGMAYLVSAVLPPQNVLMAGVFISLIFGAFLHGLSPSIASARGTLLEGVLGLSYNRWAMEIVSINELKYYQDDMRNTIVMMARGIGLCGVDRLLVDDGQDGLSAQEAISFLNVQYNFNMSYCNRYKSVAYLSLVGLGLGFRILAFLFLRYSTMKTH